MREHDVKLSQKKHYSLLLPYQGYLDNNDLVTPVDAFCNQSLSKLYSSTLIILN